MFFWKLQLPSEEEKKGHRSFVAIQLQVPVKLLLSSVHRLHNYSGRASQVKTINALLRSFRPKIHWPVS